MLTAAFDVYGTLVDPAGMAAPLRRYTDDPERVARAWRTHQLEISWLLSLMGRYEDFADVARYALDAVARSEGLDLADEERREIEHALGELEPFDDVQPALDELRAQGWRLAILSNGSARMLRPLLEHPALAGRFGEVVSADEVRVYKPARLVYAHAARRLGASPGDVFLVSANPFDAAGAKSAGMRVAQIARERPFAYGFAEPPDVVVASLAELPRALAGRPESSPS